MNRNAMNLPNILTMSRIVMIPVFVVIFYLPVQWSYMVSAAIFTLAAVTDWLDGYLARKLEQTSPFGAFIDPVADKLIVVVALVMILFKSPEWYVLIPVILIIAREITISALREWMAELGQRAAVKVSALGKWKTTFQMIAISCLIFYKPLFGLPIFEVGIVLLYLAAWLTLQSMWNYLRAALPMLLDKG